MHEHLRLLGEFRPLREPVLLAAFGGWNDFGGAATAALDHISDEWEAQDLAEVDPQPFFDFTVQRPIARVEDDQRVIDWPRTLFQVASPKGASRDFVLVSGPEPHMRWRTFTDIIAEVMQAVGATTSITIATQPAAVPHTRPLPVTLSASDASFEEQFGLRIPESRYEGPTGIVGVLNVLQRQLGWKNASLWAQAPHYLTVGPNPSAMIALVRAIDRGFHTATSVAAIEEQRERFANEVERAMEEAGDAASYIRALEEQYDANIPLLPAEGGQCASELPSSEELLSDLERFLRRQRDEPS